MPSLPAPSPRPGNNDAVNIAIRTATECGSRVAVTDIADPVFLFSKDYNTTTTMEECRTLTASLPPTRVYF